MLRGGEQKRKMKRKAITTLACTLICIIIPKTAKLWGPYTETRTLHFKLIGLVTTEVDGWFWFCPNELEMELWYRVNYNGTFFRSIAGWQRQCLTHTEDYVPCGAGDGSLDPNDFRYFDFWLVASIPYSEDVDSIDIRIRLSEDDDGSFCITSNDDILDASPPSRDDLFLRYNVRTKQWSMDVQTPWALGDTSSNVDSRTKIWFWIQSDDDNEAIGHDCHDQICGGNDSPRGENGVLASDYADVGNWYGNDAESYNWRVFSTSTFTGPRMQRNSPERMWTYVTDPQGQNTAGRTDMAIVPSMHLRTPNGRVGALLGCYRADSSTVRDGWETMPCDMLRIDPRVDFNWGNGAPGDGFSDKDSFRVRWTGEILTGIASGSYRFCLGADDGGRIRIMRGGSWITLCHDTQDSSYNRTQCCGNIDLEANTWYPIEVGFYEAGGAARVALFWGIPHTNLLPYEYHSLQTYKLFVAPGSQIRAEITALDNNLDLFLFDPFGILRASSTSGGTSDEVVNINNVGQNFGLYTIMIGNREGGNDWILFENMVADSGYPDARQGRNLIWERTGYGYIIGIADAGGYGAPSGGVHYQCISGDGPSCTTPRHDDNDYYTFWAENGQRINFSVDPIPDVVDLAIYLYDPAGNLVASSNSGGPGEWERISHPANQTGLWTVRVNLAAGTGGRYKWEFAINTSIPSQDNPWTKPIDFSFCRYRPDDRNCWVRASDKLTITQRGYDAHSTPGHFWIIFNSWVNCAASGTNMAAKIRPDTGDGECAYPVGSASNGLIIHNGYPAPMSPGVFCACYRNRTNGTERDFVGRCDAEATVTAIDFNWGSGSPAAGINSDYFNVEFYGIITPGLTGTYRFCLDSDDGGFIWVNKIPVVEDKDYHGMGTGRCGNIFLEQDTTYPIRVGVFERTGGAGVRVYVLPPGGTEVILSSTNNFKILCGGGQQVMSTVNWEVQAGTIDADFYITTAVRDEVCTDSWQTCGDPDHPTGYWLRVDVSSPNLLSVNWSCSGSGKYLSGNDCWVTSLRPEASYRTAEVEIRHQDTRSGPLRQYIVFDQDQAGWPYESNHYTDPDLNVGNGTPIGIAHWRDEAYLEITNARCDDDIDCRGPEAWIEWTVQVSQANVDVDYYLGTYMYDEVWNGTGYQWPGHRLRLDGTSPVYLGAKVSGCDWVNGNECWVKQGTNFNVTLIHSDSRSGPLMQYLSFADYSCTPDNCGCSWGEYCASGNEIKSQIWLTTISVSDRMWNDNYLDILDAVCTDPDGGCAEIGGDSQVEWTVVAGSQEKDYNIWTFLYDKVNNYVGYTNTGWDLRLDNTLPTYTISATVDDGANSPYTPGDWTRYDVRVRIQGADARSGVKEIRYCVDSSNSCTPSTSSGNPALVDVTCPSGSVCIRYVRFEVEDNVGWVTSVGSAEIRIDKENPVCSVLSIVEGTAPECQYVSGIQIWYNNNVSCNSGSGDFTVNIQASDGSGSGVDFVRFPSTVAAGGDDSASPYSWLYAWDSADTYSATANVTTYDNVGWTSGCTFTVTRDIWAPDVVIQSPAPGSWFGVDFDVTVQDADNVGGAGLEACEYKVEAYDGTGWVLTKDWSPRPCTGVVTISTEGGDCPYEGENTCKVYVRAKDRVSNWALEVTRTFSIGPFMPGSLSVWNSDATDQVILIWNDRSNVETHYQIERKLVGGNYKLIAQIDADSEDYIDTGVQEGNEYCFRIRAYYQTTGSYSNWVEGCRYVVAVPNPVLAEKDTSGIKLAWQDNSKIETGYKVYRSIDGGNLTYLDSVGTNQDQYIDSGVNDGHIYCYRVSTSSGAFDSTPSGMACFHTYSEGSQVWELDLGNPVITTPAYSAFSGKLFVGTGTDKKARGIWIWGTEDWSYVLDNDPAPPCVWEADVAPIGYVYFPTTGGKIYKFDVDGDLRRTGDVGGGIQGGCAIYSDKVFVGTSTGYVVALSRHSLKAIWHYSAGNPVNSMLAIDPDTQTIYATDSAGVVHAIDLSGSSRWTKSIDATSSPSIGPHGEVWVGANDGKLYALSSTDGSVLLSFATGGAVKSTPAVFSEGAETYVFAGSDDGKIYALKVTMSKNEYGALVTRVVKLWERATGAAIDTLSPAISQKVVWACSTDNYLYALKIEDGTNYTAAIGLSGIPVSPTIAGGLIITGTDQNRLRAYSTDSPLAPWAWTKFGANVKTDGVLRRTGSRWYLVTERDFPLCFAGAPPFIDSFPILPIDITGDGISELIFGSTKGKVWAVSATGEVLWEYSPKGSAKEYYYISAGDVDGDGEIEIVAGGDNGIHVIDKTGQPKTGFPYLTTGSVDWTPVLYDVNSDSVLEIIFTTDLPDKKLRIIEGDATEICSYEFPEGISFGAPVIDGTSIFVSVQDCLYSVDTSCNLRAGFPYCVTGKVLSEPVIGDLLGKKVIFGTNESSVYALGLDGVLAWSANLGVSGFYVEQPVLADMDNDGDLEVIVVASDGSTSRIYVLDSSGNIQSGYPVSFGARPGGPLIAGDFDYSRLDNIIFIGRDLKLRMLELDGALVDDYPVGITYKGVSEAPPSLADIDSDGRYEIIIRSWVVFEALCINVFEFGNRSSKGVADWRLIRKDATGNANF